MPSKYADKELYGCIIADALLCSKTSDGVRRSGVGSTVYRVGKGIIGGPTRFRFSLDEDEDERRYMDLELVQDQEDGTGKNDGLKKPCRQNAFIWHEDCWEALMGHFEPDRLDLDWLFEACRVAPRLISMSYSNTIAATGVFFTTAVTPLPNRPKTAIPDYRSRNISGR